MSKKASQTKLTLAACSFEVQPRDGRIQLLPYGEFRAIDGRPFDAPAWYLTEDNGRDVVDLANAARNQLVVDYEHQTLHKEKNGQPAPAAGWMRWLEFTPKGLFADVEWTDKAAAAIAAKEYRYISAVFSYDTKGYVRKIYHAALTNYPALDGMDEVLAAASAQFLNPETEQNPMKELLQQLFGLPQATEDELTAALTALLQAKPQGVALSADIFKELADKDSRIAALSALPAAQPDPTQFAPVALVQELQSQLAALTAERTADKGAELIAAALAAGKLLPAQKEWAESVLKQDGGLAFLSSYIDNAQPVAALTGTQTGGKAAETVVALTAEEAAAAKMLGMSHAEFAKIKTEKDDK
ncbi:phage protease [Bergeriella denitrificans]|uniref:Protein gp32 n=1 Tax=Bergeriella denitrificans TaxID=494 RepID=A0A378UGD0_BERDE|nr:phage protease [Bergeriella denitrificans]STZ75561.1 protein gp32 [Bergeriella denitrificans]